MKPKKRIADFRTEDAERKFWAEHDSTEFLDWSTARKTRLPHLKRAAKDDPKHNP